MVSLRPRPRFAAALTLLLLLAGGTRMASRAQSKKPIDPDVVHSAEGTTEVGVLGGAAYRIDIPSDWNGSLVVYYHGYAEHGASFHITEHLHPDL